MDIWDIIVVYALVYAPFLIMMFVQKKLNFGYDTRRKATILEASLQKNSNYRTKVAAYHILLTSTINHNSLPAYVNSTLFRQL